MSKKKKKGNGKGTEQIFKNYKEYLSSSFKPMEELYEKETELHGIIHKQNWNFITNVNAMTRSHFDIEWVENLKENVKSKLWKKHKSLVDDCIGLGKNKAVIGVGSGASFNINKDILRHYLNRDGIREWENRAYITIAANHQFKPLLEMGIIPDFVLLVDASDVVFDQLTKDIPEHGKSSILIAGLHCSPKVLNKWSEQGRDIRFILNSANETRDMFQKLVGKDPNLYTVELGGNVLNGAWVIGISKMHSNVFVAVGNDLSFKLADNIEEQRKNYYSDKDYSTNAKVTGTGRDEAARFKRWAGFSITPRKIFTSSKNRYNIKLDLVGTSHTLWVYKNWLESTLMRHIKHPISFHYFNCSEGGILGVMSKCGDSMDLDKMRDTSNWYMFDDVCRFYHTAILSDVLPHFEKCLEVFRCPGLPVQYAEGGECLGLGDTVRITDLPSDTRDKLLEQGIKSLQGIPLRKDMM
jgi:hypothetical protein